nr:tyrosine-type recombinase/integrase [Natronorubrum daqingense]
MKRPHFEGITGNPAAVVMEEIPRTYRDRPDCATWESACKIIQYMPDPRDKTVAIVLAKTGCRLLEGLSIREEDLMFEEGFIRLRNRKGGRQTVVPVDDETINAEWDHGENREQVPENAVYPLEHRVAGL